MLKFVEWPNSKFFVGREYMTVNFRFSLWAVTPSSEIQFLDSSATFRRQIKRVGIIAKKF